MSARSTAQHSTRHCNDTRALQNQTRDRALPVQFVRGARATAAGGSGPVQLGVGAQSSGVAALELEVHVLAHSVGCVRVRLALARRLLCGQPQLRVPQRIRHRRDRRQGRKLRTVAKAPLPKVRARFSAAVARA
eukprot:3934780-Rhodomonas_salina.5